MPKTYLHARMLSNAYWGDEAQKRAFPWAEPGNLLMLVKVESDAPFLEAFPYAFEGHPLTKDEVELIDGQDDDN